MKKFINWMNQNHPKTEKDFEEGPFELMYKVSGSFRQVYIVKGLDLIIKFPTGDDGSYKENLGHSLNEIEFIERCSKIKHLKRLMPKIYYSNRKTGVIVMKKYKTAKSNKAVETLLTNLIKDSLRIKRHKHSCDVEWHEDMKANNLGYGGTYERHYVILDAGLMGGH